VTNFTTTILTDQGVKIRVALCDIHRNNRIFAGDVYGTRRLKSDGNHTSKPCHDCERKAPCTCMVEADEQGVERVLTHSSSCPEYLP